jgi:hypothetical protein
MVTYLSTIFQLQFQEGDGAKYDRLMNYCNCGCKILMVMSNYKRIYSVVENIFVLAHYPSIIVQL